MNILVFSWRDPKHPLAGGAEQVMHEHMKGWIAAGHTVTFFSSRFPDSKKEEKLDGIDIVRQGKDLFFGVQLAAFLWYLFGSHRKFDLVIDEFHGVPFFTPLYVRIPKLAVLQEVAKEVWWLNPLRKPFNWIIGWIGYTFEPYIFLLYRNIFFMTGSQSAKNDLMSLGIKDTHVIIVPHGFIKRVLKRLPQKEAIKTVVFLGALTRDKGIEDAIKTFALLNQKGVYKFWVMGNGEARYLEFLKKTSFGMGLKTQIRFFGRVSEEEKFSRLARAHVLINPSVREGWGLVNIEANSVDTPVIAYKSPGLVDSVKSGVNGLICKENTPEDLADRVSFLLKDQELYQKLQKNAKKWAGKFSWEESKQQSLKLIKDIT